MIINKIKEVVVGGKVETKSYQIILDIKEMEWFNLDTQTRRDINDLYSPLANLCTGLDKIVVDDVVTGVTIPLLENK